jgi:adenylate kinase family enzyme
MHRALLIVITGPPATGKTYLGKLLSEQYSLPHFSKDSFKDSIASKKP